MKKATSLVLALMLMLSLLPAAVAEEAAPTVYVTIACDGLVLVQHPVTLTDADEDGALTIADALYLAHEDAFEGGAEAGFTAEMGSYGLMITRLWGVENGGSYGYYVNNSMAMGLSDALSDGDYVTAYVYSDLVTWSDTYTYFDVNTAAAGEVTLTLSAIGFDPVTYAPVASPVADAEITVNGISTGVKTDENGMAVITVSAGDVVSATSESMTLVPPCCVIAADEADQQAA